MSSDMFITMCSDVGRDNLNASMSPSNSNPITAPAKYKILRLFCSQNRIKEAIHVDTYY